MRPARGFAFAAVLAVVAPLTCEDYFREDPMPPVGTVPVMFSYDAFFDEFDPTGDRGRVNPSGTTWQPTLFLEVDRTKEVPTLVRKCAGPFGPSCGAS